MSSTRRSGRYAWAVLACGLILGNAGSAAWGDTAVRLLIRGALDAPGGTTDDGAVTVRVAAELPVFQVVDGAVAPEAFGLADAALWQDAESPPGFRAPAALVVIRFGGAMVTAALVATSQGIVTAVSGTPPYHRISGTWTAVDGASAGIAGAAPADLVLTLFIQDNEGPPSRTETFQVALDGILDHLNAPLGTDVASIAVARGVPVLAVAGDALGARTGSLLSYEAFGSVSYLGVSAIDFGGTYLLEACAFPSETGAIACLVGASGDFARASGTSFRLAGVYATHVAGIDLADQLLAVTFAVP